MKELSIEQKAQAYDGVREKIAIRFGSNVADEIFSQFEMSEDERIRKLLIEAVIQVLQDQYCSNRGVSKEKVVAWLENQGEHAKFRDSIQVGDKVTRNRDGMLVNLSQLKRVAKPAENKGEHDMGISESTKQKLEDNLNKALEKETPESFNKFLDEQKPADKVEPSIFKDRLLELFQIFRWRCKDHILTNGEILEYVDAHIQELIDTMEKPADTEKGAKGNDREIPFIEPPLTIKHAREVMGIKHDTDWSEEDEARFESCIEVLQTSDGYDTINAKWFKSLKDRAQPLPKQEWSEEDEVKINRIVACLENLNVADNDILLKDAAWLKSIKDRVQPQPKRVWSEEDEIMIDTIIYDLERHGGKEGSCYSAEINFLKSLKERVGCEVNCTTTKDWSEEDKRKINRIYFILRQAADTHAFSTTCRLIGDKECVELQDFLKSIRPQITWKPSDEQMRELSIVATGKGWFSKEILSKLLEQLKRLREE